MTNTETETTIEIDAPEGYLECKAYLDVRIDNKEVIDARIYRWDFNGMKQARDTLISLIGHTEVIRIEEYVADNYWDMEARK